MADIDGRGGGGGGQQQQQHPLGDAFAGLMQSRGSSQQTSNTPRRKRRSGGGGVSSQRQRHGQHRMMEELGIVDAVEDDSPLMDDVEDNVAEHRGVPESGHTHHVHDAEWVQGTYPPQPKRPKGYKLHQGLYDPESLDSETDTATQSRTQSQRHASGADIIDDVQDSDGSESDGGDHDAQVHDAAAIEAEVLRAEEQHHFEMTQHQHQQRQRQQAKQSAARYGVRVNTAEHHHSHAPAASPPAMSHHTGPDAAATAQRPETQALSPQETAGKASAASAVTSPYDILAIRHPRASQRQHQHPATTFQQRLARAEAVEEVASPPSSPPKKPPHGLTQSTQIPSTIRQSLSGSSQMPHHRLSPSRERHTPTQSSPRGPPPSYTHQAKNPAPVTDKSSPHLDIPFLELQTPRRAPPSAETRALLDSNHKRRKVIKNGLADRLLKSLSIRGSELNFWLHSQQQRSRGSSLQIAAEDACVSVTAVVRSHSCAICRCRVLYGDTPHASVFLHMGPALVNRIGPRRGQVLQLHPPWQQYKTNNNRVVVFDAIFVWPRAMPGPEEMEVAASCRYALDSSNGSNSSNSGSQQPRGTFD